MKTYQYSCLSEGHRRGKKLSQKKVPHGLQSSVRLSTPGQWRKPSRHQAHRNMTPSVRNRMKHVHNIISNRLSSWWNMFQFSTPGRWPWHKASSRLVRAPNTLGHPPSQRCTRQREAQCLSLAPDHSSRQLAPSPKDSKRTKCNADKAIEACHLTRATKQGGETVSKVFSVCLHYVGDKLTTSIQNLLIYVTSFLLFQRKEVLRKLCICIICITINIQIFVITIFHGLHFQGN